jgi:cytoskeletal protein CcmA (bactofilin family)
MTVVGKISSEETLNVFGRVEGELHASIVRISDGEWKASSPHRI